MQIIEQPLMPISAAAQHKNMAMLVDAMKSGEYAKNPDWKSGRSADGHLWSFSSLICEVYRTLTARGDWTLDEYPEYLECYGKSYWDFRPWGEPIYEFFGIAGPNVVKEWLSDPSGHATPVWANYWGFQEDADFICLADAFERTYLKPIPDDVSKCTKASTKGDASVKRGRSPFEKSALAYQ